MFEKFPIAKNNIENTEDENKSPESGSGKKMNRRSFLKLMGSAAVTAAVSKPEEVLAQIASIDTETKKEKEWIAGMQELWQEAIYNDLEQKGIYVIDGEGNEKWIEDASSESEDLVITDMEFYEKLFESGIKELRNVHTHPLSAFAQGGYISEEEKEKYRQNPKGYSSMLPAMPPSYDENNMQGDITAMDKLAALAKAKNVKVSNFVLDPSGVWQYSALDQKMGQAEKEAYDDYQQKKKSLLHELFKNESVQKTKAYQIYQSDQKNINQALQYLDFSAFHKIDAEARNLLQKIHEGAKEYFQKYGEPGFDLQVGKEFINKSSRGELSEGDIEKLIEHYRENGVDLQYKSFYKNKKNS